MPTTNHEFDLGDTVYVLGYTDTESPCDTCEGLTFVTLSSPHTKKIKCPVCNGKGKQENRERNVIEDKISSIVITKTIHSPPKEKYKLENYVLYPWEPLYSTRKKAEEALKKEKKDAIKWQKARLINNETR